MAPQSVKAEALVRDAIETTMPTLLSDRERAGMPTTREDLISRALRIPVAKVPATNGELSEQQCYLVAMVLGQAFHDLPRDIEIKRAVDYVLGSARSSGNDWAVRPYIAGVLMESEEDLPEDLTLLSPGQKKELVHALREKLARVQEWEERRGLRKAVAPTGKEAAVTD